MLRREHSEEARGGQKEFIARLDASEVWMDACLDITVKLGTTDQRV